MFTCNKGGKFNQSQIIILIGLSRHKNINIIAAPPIIYDMEFDPTMFNEEYLLRGFKEVKVRLSPKKA